MRPHKRNRRVRAFGFLFDVLAVGAAVAVRVAAPSPAWVEAHYANGAYPTIDRTVRALTGPLPFCLGDVLFALAIVSLGLYLANTIRRARHEGFRGAARALGRTLALGCVLFVWFVVSWGYNYSRVPLAEKIVVHEARTDDVSVAAFADRVVDHLSHYASAAHGEHLDDAALATRLIPAFEATTHRLGDTGAFAPPRVKPTIFQPMMQLSGTSGFTDPWTHEVNLDAGASAYERPAIYTHEWAHIAGFADESEANFIAVIACTTSRDPLLAYSGWILVWFNLPSDVRITHRMSVTAYNDIAAIRARYLRNVNRNVERAQRVAYDGYLKSNHVKAGYQSYRLFIRWMTGADFDAAGLPLVRG